MSRQKVTITTSSMKILICTLVNDFLYLPYIKLSGIVAMVISVETSKQV